MPGIIGSSRRLRSGFVSTSTAVGWCSNERSTTSVSNSIPFAVILGGIGRVRAASSCSGASLRPTVNCSASRRVRLPAFVA
jgi:hypothetical protein